MSPGLSARALRLMAAALLVPILCSLAPAPAPADEPPPGAWPKRWIDASAKPATIDFRNTAGEMKGEDVAGNLRVGRGHLKICDNADDVAGGRPAAFVSSAGSGQVLISFKRVKR